MVVRPEGGADAAGRPVGAHHRLPLLVDELESVDGVARVDGNVDRVGVYVVDRDSKVVGGIGPPALGGNWTDAPAAGGEGLALVEGEEPQGPDEVVLDEQHGRARRLRRRRHRSRSSAARREPDCSPRWSGIAGFPEGGSLNGATFALFDTPTAQDLFLDGRGRLQRHLGDRRGRRLAGRAARRGRRRCCPTASRRSPATTPPTSRPRDLLEAISFLTTFLLIFAGIALVVGAFLIVNTFSILVAQRSRELALLRALGASRRQVIRSVQLEAFVLGVLGSTIGLGLGVLLAMLLRVLFGQFGLDLSGQPLDLRAAHGAGVVRRRRRRHDGRGLAARPAHRPDRAGPGACATTSPCPRRRCTAACWSGSR